MNPLLIFTGIVLMVCGVFGMARETKKPCMTVKHPDGSYEEYYPSEDTPRGRGKSISRAFKTIQDGEPITFVGDRQVYDLDGYDEPLKETK